MLAPKFRVSQTETHVIVEMILSSCHSKLSDAQFDIRQDLFSFSCRPYYLRLRFEQELTEGLDERATYDLETNTLLVYLPKLHKGEHFTQIDNPAFLMATQLQRAAMVMATPSPNSAPTTTLINKPKIEVLSSSPAVAEEEDDDESDSKEEVDDGEVDELDTEYVQSLPANEDHDILQSSQALPTYGFGNFFSGMFRGLPEDVVYDATELPEPDRTTARERRALRFQTENRDFNEEALLCSLADEDGEVHALLHNGFVPWYVDSFEAALEANGVRYARHRGTASTTTTNGSGIVIGAMPVDAAEEEEVPLRSHHSAAAGGGAVVSLWEGNVASFDPQSLPVDTSAGDTTTHSAAHFAPPPAAEGSTPSSQETQHVARKAMHSGRLAALTQPAVVAFTMEESTALARIKPRRDLFAPAPRGIDCLLVDLLLSYVYDHLATSGTGCSESCWSLCKLSTHLSWLDAPVSVYDTVVQFTRRLLIYPLYRHLDVLFRCLRDVSVLLRLGPKGCVRALLSMKFVLEHSEHKHVLSQLFLDPLIDHLMNRCSAEHLTKLALEVHEVATRERPVVRTVSLIGAAEEVEQPHSSSLIPTAAAAAVLLKEQKVTEEPIHLLSIGLPIRVDHEEEEEEDA